MSFTQKLGYGDFTFEGIIKNNRYGNVSYIYYGKNTSKEM